MRIFTAIKITPNDKFLNLLKHLKTNLSDEKIKWVDSNKLHITLKFFGDINKNEIPKIIEAHKNICSNHSSFKLNIENIGIFGSSYKPKVIWLGIKPVENIKAIAYGIQRSFILQGHKADNQNFVPHLTIGRIKSIENKIIFQKIMSQYKNVLIQSLVVTEIILFESVLTPKEAIHNMISKFKVN